MTSADRFEIFSWRQTEFMITQTYRDEANHSKVIFYEATTLKHDVLAYYESFYFNAAVYQFSLKRHHLDF